MTYNIQNGGEVVIARDMLNEARHIKVCYGRSQAFWFLANTWTALPALLVVDMLEGLVPMVTLPDGSMTVEWTKPYWTPEQRYL